VVTYGIGSESRDLPGFIVFVSGGSLPSAGKSGWGNGFLPSVYQGVQCRTGGDPVLYLSDPEGMDRSLRRLSLDALRDLNELQKDTLGNPETATRIAQYEMAFRMQVVVPELLDVSREPSRVLEDYGAHPAQPASRTTACSRVAWSRKVCGSSSSSIGAGTFTGPTPGKTSATTWCAAARRWTGPSPH